MRISNLIYSIDIPPGWRYEYQEMESQLHIFHPNGRGSLTISSYFSSFQGDAMELIEKFTKERGEIYGNRFKAEAQFSDTKNGEVYIVHALFLVEKNQNVLISYQVQKEHYSSEEYEAALQSMKSISIKDNHKFRDQYAFLKKAFDDADPQSFGALDEYDGLVFEIFHRNAYVKNKELFIKNIADISSEIYGSNPVGALIDFYEITEQFFTRYPEGISEPH